jgi:hypothetical protein
MIESVPDGYAVRRIKRKQLLDKVQKMSVNDVSRWYNLLT